MEGGAELDQPAPYMSAAAYAEDKLAFAAAEVVEYPQRVYKTVEIKLINQKADVNDVDVNGVSSRKFSQAERDAAQAERDISLVLDGISISAQGAFGPALYAPGTSAKASSEANGIFYGLGGAGQAPAWGSWLVAPRTLWFNG